MSTGKAARIPEATATQYVKNYTHREKYQEMIRKMEQKTAQRYETVHFETIIRNQYASMKRAMQSSYGKLRENLSNIILPPD